LNQDCIATKIALLYKIEFKQVLGVKKMEKYKQKNNFAMVYTTA
jgi:hypothetical protein